MGLLDGVLGQVLGQVLGGGSSGQGGGFSGTRPGGGFGGPAGGTGGLPGGLGNLPGGLGNMLSGKGGPIALAILALLASKHLKSGAGGYGSILHDMFGGRRDEGGLTQGSLPGGGGMLGQNDADDRRGSGSAGGFMDEIGGMLGGGSGQSAGGGLGGALGGGLAGGMLGGGLGELLNRFSQNGRGDVMQSWIGSGPNQAVGPHDLEQSLGADTIDDLSRQTGLERGDLLSQLSQALPEVVDRLTPEGRLPSPDEESRWV
jgi:uncharacterized protein YidB (DUF937 family)